MAIKSILVSQPKPEGDKSPYYDLADKYKIKIDFRPFIKVEGVDAKEFRNQKVNIAEHTAVILTSKIAADHFFRIAEETRFEVPESMKYFCISEAVAKYLQKFIAYRKRKIFFAGQKINELADILKKHKKELYLLPSSDILKPIIPALLQEAGIDYTRSIFYKTVSSDLSDLENVFYDLLVFYSPAGIESLFKNFPNFSSR